MGCPNLKTFKIYNIHKAPQILNYLIKHYPDHFICAPEISVLEHIPLKLSYFNLEKLANYRFLSHIEYLVLNIPIFIYPSAGGWNDYQQVVEFCPNLKGIIFTNNNEFTNISSTTLDHLPFGIQHIWNQRKSFFESKN